MKSVRYFRFSIVLALAIASMAAIAIAQEKTSWTIKPAPRQEEFWWQQRQAEKNERIKQGHVDLLFIGDSITHGWEGAGKQTWKKYYENRNAANIGFSGDRVEHVLWRLDHGNIDGISPKLAILMIGTNNAGAFDPSKLTAEGIEMIVEKLRKKLPGTKVLVLAIFPRGADKNNSLRRTNEKTNEIISKLDDGKMVFFLDIGSKFLKPDSTLGKDIMPDLLHPNEKGYEIWAEAIEPTVAKLMGEKK